MALADALIDQDGLRDRLIQVVDRATTDIRDIVLPEAHRHGTELVSEVGNVLRGVTDNVQAILDKAVVDMRTVVADLNTTLDRIERTVSSLNGANVRLEIPKL